MKIDNEAHRVILRTGVENIPITGPAGHPEMLAKIQLVHEVIAAIERAVVPRADMAEQESA